MSRRNLRAQSCHVLPVSALTLAIGAGALLAGLATAGAAAPSTAASPAIIKVVLTNASNGTTTVVTKGWEVVVKLSSSDGFDWTEASVAPSATAQVVLHKVSGHVSRNGSSTTTFDVIGYGTATLMATGSAKCTSTVCLPLSQNWTANVDSVVLDPPGPTG
jgi:hypothetical protein